MKIKRAWGAEISDWLRLRRMLWPDGTEQEHRAEMAAACANPSRFAAFVVYASSGKAAGFAEATLRSDYVNGTKSSPVGFLEGLYVAPEVRRQGVARRLVAAVEHWVKEAGCSELASDVELSNLESQRMHQALGFDETERVIYYRKDLSA